MQNQFLAINTMGSTYKELFKLYDCIQCGNLNEIRQYLTDSQINLNEVLPCKGIGVLHLAVGIDPEETSRECTELLLRHGADPNLCNYDGVTPLHIAAIWGRVDNLKLLIGCGGDPSLRDIDGHSSFDYAAREEQWNVYDYLHNVEDELDDSDCSPCAYSLDLERILVTTDQMVAEYEPLPINATTCRKSDMVREWCEKTSLVMNKLYPTILSDTFTIDNDPALYRSINITKNLTFDLTNNSNKCDIDDTYNSFKTCAPAKDATIEISGIERLQITSDDSKDDLPQKQRLSLYENFSLPGSPTSIIHRNYNSKSSLNRRKCERLPSQSIFTEDCSSVMDKALAVVQNRTNEWISSSSRSSDCTEIKACNTRRSSASSGVSSTSFSTGSIALANVQQEYKYEDKEEDVVLIEKRLLVSTIILPLDESCESPDQTMQSVASSLPPSMSFDTNTLRTELLKLGFNPGPIQDTNKTLYLKKLHSLKKNPIVVSKQGKTYSIELEKSLRNDEWMKDLTPYIELENRARTDFANPNKKWREGAAKTSFTYLLLDPRLTDNLPVKAGKQCHHVSWVTFVNSIFYVGKGKRSRPYSHLYQALNLWKRNFKQSQDKKVQHILDIWSDKVGVVCLHIFQNVIPAEAYSNEAAMIDVLGLQNLKNLKIGNYYGEVSSWPMKERRMFGLYLLYKAMQIFISEGERQLRPEDID